MKRIDGIKSRCNNPEEGALEQARNLTKLPFLHKHVALMSDCHQGYGMPIGGVIACDGVIIPNAVGVDIGCLDMDTEFLTSNGWKKISNYAKGDDVLQYNKETDLASFVEPVNYIVKDCKEFIHFKNSKGFDQMLSDEHKMLVWKGYSKRGYKNEDMVAEDVEKMGNKLTSGFYGVKTAFIIDEAGIELSDEEIMMDIMLVADGCIQYNRENKNYMYLHLKKDRKIKKAKDILLKNNIEYKEKLGKDGSTHIYFYVDEKFDKTLSKYWKANKKQLSLISEECLFRDGHKGYRSFFSSTNKESADVIQFAFSATGIRAGISVVKHNGRNRKDVYVVTPTRNNVIGIPDNNKRVASKDGKKYCFTVPTGYFIARRNDKIFITGNCGMSAVKTSLTNISTETRKKIIGEIRKTIPVGFNKHKEKQDESFMPETEFCEDGDLRKPKPIHKKYPSRIQLPVIYKQYNNALYSLGTLGGGNHFIEIQKGDDGYIWIMIHSGSRNLGKQVADHYNKLAIELNKKRYSNTQPDLAFLPIDSEEGKAYIREMNYCVDYALANRKLMMSRCLNAVGKYLPEIVLNSTNEFINISHNYARLESHFGKNVWVHRKGATSAKEGEIGIIPGSQGSKSYIVKGKGNPESFMSCSHGAGRKMGRREAQKKLNINEQTKLLDDMGVIHSIRGEKDLDEAPGAYKDINIVMEEQKDLVDIVVELKPLGVVKG